VGPAPGTAVGAKGARLIAGSCELTSQQRVRRAKGFPWSSHFSTHHSDLNLTAFARNRVDQVLTLLHKNYVNQSYQQDRLLNFCEAVS
jgi:hypothetical protein